MKTIVLTGGGTAGHVMPNIYLLEDLKKHFDKIYYIGSKDGIEKNIVLSYKIPYFEICTTKLKRGKIFSNLAIPFKLLKGICECKKILKKIRPDVIFSKGGFVGLPVCYAGKKLKIPIIAHESDFSFGLANKLILKKCTVMCVNFAHLAKVSPKVKYSGAILSPEFSQKNFTVDKSITLNPNKKTILFLGGSIGAKKINETIFESLNELTKNYNVLHHVGKGNLTKNKNEYDNYFQFEFYDNMPYLYSISSLVVGRAGAGVVFETLYMQKPLLLIPLQNKASRGDQVQNAEFFSKKKCAQILYESNLNKQTLHKNIKNALSNEKIMIESIKKLNLKNGKETVLQEILKVIN